MDIKERGRSVPAGRGLKLDRRTDSWFGLFPSGTTQSIRYDDKERGRVISNRSAVWQYQSGTAIRPIG
jgi:hypothetical protein